LRHSVYLQQQGRRLSWRAHTVEEQLHHLHRTVYLYETGLTKRSPLHPMIRQSVKLPALLDSRVLKEKLYLHWRHC